MFQLPLPWRGRALLTVPHLIAVWALGLGALAIVAAVYVSIRCYIGIPYMDQWSIIGELARHNGSYSLPVLWTQHNEHRFPFLKLLVMADLYWFKGRNLSLYIEVYLVQIVHLGAFAWLLWRTGHWRGWMVVAGTGLAAFALFWISQWETFVNPFGVSVAAVYVGATLAMAAFAVALESPGQFSPWFWASLAAAFFAEASQANGLLVWPLLLIFAVRFRMPAAQTLTLAIAAVLSTALYFHGYHAAPGHAKPTDSLKQPGRMLLYVLLYFGSGWNRWGVWTGRAIALAGLVTAPVLYARELLRPKTSVFSFAVLSLCMFLLGTGIVTSLGRLNFKLVQATASRYQTPVLLFWLSLAVYAIDPVYRLRPNRTTAAATGVLVLATALLPSAISAISNVLEVKRQADAGALALIADVKDDRMIRLIFPVPDEVFREYRPFLLEHGTSVYGEPRYRLWGRAIATQYSVAPPDRCSGQITLRRRVDDPQFPGWELEGSAWDEKAGRPVESLVAATDGGTIKGFGITGLPSTKLVKRMWRVYIREMDDLAGVRVYGLVDGGRSACLVAPA